MLKPSAVTDNRTGDGVGNLIYQCHHSRPTNATKMKGVMIKGIVSLVNVRLMLFFIDQNCGTLTQGTAIAHLFLIFLSNQLFLVSRRMSEYFFHGG